jgi:hypothetical protein
MRNSVVHLAFDSAIRTLGSAAAAVTTDSSEIATATAPTKPAGALIEGNVVIESYDTSTIFIGGSHHIIRGNLALGTIKETSKKSSFDQQLPATFEVGSLAGNITVTGNVAAGSERLGFYIPGDACVAVTGGNSQAGRYSNNSVHSSLAGVLLHPSGAAGGGGCTALVNATIYLNWDFGFITMKGIETDVLLQDLVVAGEYWQTSDLEMWWFKASGCPLRQPEARTWKVAVLFRQAADGRLAIPTTLAGWISALKTTL